MSQDLTSLQANELSLSTDVPAPAARPGLLSCARRVMIFLLALAGLETFLSYYFFVANSLSGSCLNPDPMLGGCGGMPGTLSELGVARVALPLALLVGGLPWLVRRQDWLSRTQRVAVVGGLVLLAGGLYFLHAEPLILLRLAGVFFPETVARPVGMAWQMAMLAALFILAAGRRLRPLWRVLLVGGTGGLLLVLCLAYPAYTLAYSLLVSPGVYTGPLHMLAAAGFGLAGLVVLLVTGPLAILWSRTQASGRRPAGALAGAALAVVLFAGLAAPLAGLAAYASLVPAAWERSGFGPDQQMLKIVTGANAALPLLTGLFWLLLGGGAVTGALTGRYLLPRLVQAGAGSTEPSFHRPLLWPLALLAATLMLLISAILAGGFIQFMIQEALIEDTADRYGYALAWSPAWSSLINSAQFWLLLALLQVTGLAWLRRMPSVPTAQRCLLRVCLLTGLAGLIAAPLLYFAINTRWYRELPVLAPILVLMILGLELVILSWRRLAEPAAAPRPAPPFAWAGAGAVGGAAAAVITFLATAVIAAVVFSSNLLRDDPHWSSGLPPGPGWTDTPLAPLFIFQFAQFFLLLGALMAGGALLGLALKLANRLWEARPRPDLQKLRPGCLVSLLLLLPPGMLMFLAVRVVEKQPPDDGFITFFHAVIALALLLAPARPPGWLAAALAAAAGVSATTGSGGNGWTGLFSLAFSLGLVLVQTRFVRRWPWPGGRPVLTMLGWGLLAVSLAYWWRGQQVGLYSLAGLFGLVLVLFLKVERLRLAGMLVAFGWTLEAGAAWALARHYEVLLDTSPWWPAYLLLSGLAVAAVYRYLSDYTSPAWRWSALVLAPLLIWLLAYFSRQEIALAGGVSRYEPDSGAWEQFTPANSALGGPLNYRIFRDSQGRLWFAAGTGLVARYDDGKWEAVLLEPCQNLWDCWPGSRLELQEERPVLAEDLFGRVWLASKAIFGQVPPELDRNYFQGATVIAPGQQLLPVDMAFDAAGNLFLATAGAGVVSLARDNLDWEPATLVDREYNVQLQEPGRVILIDKAGGIWYGAANGLSHYDGSKWELGLLPDPVTNLLEDAGRRLWVGTESGGFRREGATWISFAQAGWPGETGVEALLEDSQGGIWAGTAAGALRYEGERWANRVPGFHVTGLAEGPPGIIWLGARQGLVRYELETGAQQEFTAANSGLAADWVRDVTVEPDGRVWVSTFETGPVASSPWPGIGLVVVFLGLLFLRAYGGYTRLQAR